MNVVTLKAETECEHETTIGLRLFDRSSRRFRCWHQKGKSRSFDQLATGKLFSVPIDAGTVLMHADNGRVDHLHRGVMSPGECAHDLGPDARSSPANEAIVAGRVRTEVVRQVAPCRPGS